MTEQDRARMANALGQRAEQNKGKQDAFWIVWNARESCTPGSTAVAILSRVLDHLMTPERWS